MSNLRCFVATNYWTECCYQHERVLEKFVDSFASLTPQSWYFYLSSKSLLGMTLTFHFINNVGTLRNIVEVERTQHRESNMSERTVNTTRIGFFPSSLSSQFGVRLFYLPPHPVLTHQWGFCRKELK